MADNVDYEQEEKDRRIGMKVREAFADPDIAGVLEGARTKLYRKFVDAKTEDAALDVWRDSRALAALLTELKIAVDREEQVQIDQQRRDREESSKRRR